MVLNVMDKGKEINLELDVAKPEKDEKRRRVRLTKAT